MPTLQWGRARMSAEMPLIPDTWSPIRGWLQWGRARMSAEMWRWCVRGAFGGWLQWGRARMSAEIRPTLRQARRSPIASMGPRSDERGNQRPGYDFGALLVASMGPRSDERGNGARGTL